MRGVMESRQHGPSSIHSLWPQLLSALSNGGAETLGWFHRLLLPQFAATRIITSHVTAYWVPRGAVSEEHLALRINAAYTHVCNCLCADFGIEVGQFKRVYVVCGDENVFPQQVTRVLDERRDDSGVFGAYLPGMVTAFITGDVNDPSFPVAMARELCHALCDRWSHWGLTNPWAFEGYAADVSHRAHPQLRDALQRAFAGTIDQKGNIDTDLNRILTTESCTCHRGESIPGAELLIKFLRAEGCQRKRVWQLVRYALEQPAGLRGPLAIGAFEEAFGALFSNIQAMFTRFCVSLFREYSEARGQQL